MSKPVLGRGLGSLLPDRAAPHRGIPAPTAPAARVSPGVAVLISGDRIVGAAERMAAKVNSSSDTGQLRQRLRIRWMLFVADLSLCGMAAVVILRQSAPARVSELAAGVSGMLIGAWLGCSAVTMGDTPTDKIQP